MAFTKIWVHAVWATKNRHPFLVKEIRSTVFHHIKENAEKKNIYLDFINGYTDHVHCLISLKAEQSIANVMQLLKGESSYWVNKEKLISSGFGWQEEYFAVSVSESQIHTVRNYIRNQEVHHKKLSFQEEYEKFMVKFGFEEFNS